MPIPTGDTLNRCPFMLGLLIPYSDIWKVPFYLKGNLARDVLFRMLSARLLTFCLLIVRYMLSDKIAGKSALKARTFLHERD